MSYVVPYSFSRAWLYQSCKQRYSYKYTLKVKPLAKDMSFKSWSRMLIGTLIHAALEALLQGQSPEQFVADVIAEERAKGLRQEQLDALATMEPEALQIAANFADWLPLSDWELVYHNGVPLSEYKVVVPLKSGVGEFLGYVDCVLRHKETGRVLVCDFKSKATMSSDGDQAFIVQLPLYISALRQLGVIDTNMFAILELRSSLPKRKPRKIRIDEGSIEVFRQSVDGCFQYMPHFCSDEYLDAIWADYEKVCVSMSRFSHQYAYRNRSSFNCKDCEFRLLCEAQMKGHDVGYIAKHHYTTPPASLAILEQEQ